MDYIYHTFSYLLYRLNACEDGVDIEEGKVIERRDRRRRERGGGVWGFHGKMKIYSVRKKRES